MKAFDKSMTLPQRDVFKEQLSHILLSFECFLLIKSSIENEKNDSFEILQVKENVDSYSILMDIVKNME